VSSLPGGSMETLEGITQNLQIFVTAIVSISNNSISLCSFAELL
jgi:hypothetical protein